MIVALVYVNVKPEFVDDFKRESEINAQESRKEPGVIRFDVLQNTTEPNKFILYEAYKDEESAKAHKDTPHYQKWRDAVAPMMAEPRQTVKYWLCEPH